MLVVAHFKHNLRDDSFWKVARLMAKLFRSNWFTKPTIIRQYSQKSKKRAGIIPQNKKADWVGCKPGTAGCKAIELTCPPLLNDRLLTGCKRKYTPQSIEFFSLMLSPNLLTFFNLLDVRLTYWAITPLNCCPKWLPLKLRLDRIINCPYTN